MYPMKKRMLVMAIPALALLVQVSCAERAPEVTETASAVSSNLLVVTSAAYFDAEVLKSELPVVVDFWATWCPPCRKMNPIVESLAGKFQGAIRFAKVDVDKNQELAGRFGIESIPTFVVIYKGEVVAANAGARSAAAFEEWIRESLKKKGVEL